MYLFFNFAFNYVFYRLQIFNDPEFDDNHIRSYLNYSNFDKEQERVCISTINVLFDEVFRLKIEVFMTKSNKNLSVERTLLIVFSLDVFLIGYELSIKTK